MRQGNVYFIIWSMVGIRLLGSIQPAVVHSRLYLSSGLGSFIKVQKKNHIEGHGCKLFQSDGGLHEGAVILSGEDHSIACLVPLGSLVKGSSQCDAEGYLVSCILVSAECITLMTCIQVTVVLFCGLMLLNSLVKFCA